MGNGAEQLKVVCSSYGEQNQMCFSREAICNVKEINEKDK